MTVRDNGAGTPIATGVTGPLIYLFEWLDWMRTASPTGPGFTIDQSSDGTTGGSGDNIAAFADLSQYVASSSESWFVLEDPGGRQELFYRTSTNDGIWSRKASPTGVFTGGTSGTPPTATDEYAVFTADTILGSGANVLHCCADDASPYGWATYVHASGNFSTAKAGMANFPIVAGLDTSDADPYVAWYDGGGFGWTKSLMATESTTLIAGRCSGLLPGLTTWDTISALVLESHSGQVAPDGSAQDTDGSDLTFPITFGRRAALSNGRNKGVADFVQWNGTTRAPCETFASATRISFGAANVAWGGTTPSST